MTTSAASSPSATRRARQRQATLAEIKSLARQQLAEHGTGAVNLRAIARQMGTASSALYRYFPSHDDLISALCADAYEAGAEAMAAARDQVPPADHAGRWKAVCGAFRQWALANRADFALIAGTPVPGYRAPWEATGPAAARHSAIPAGVYIAAVEAGAADPGRTQMPSDLPAGPLLHDLLSRAGLAPSIQVAAIIASAWASVRGYLAMEIFGSLPQIIPDTGTLYQAHIRTIMTGMGFDLARSAGGSRNAGLAGTEMRLRPRPADGRPRCRDRRPARRQPDSVSAGTKPDTAWTTEQAQP